MITTIKQGTTLKVLNEILSKISKKKRKGFNAKKFCGIIPLKENPLEIQKNLRNEW